jgi:hypothetical protein
MEMDRAGRKIFIDNISPTGAEVVVTPASPADLAWAPFQESGAIVLLYKSSPIDPFT